MIIPTFEGGKELKGLFSKPYDSTKRKKSLLQNVFILKRVRSFFQEAALNKT